MKDKKKLFKLLLTYQNVQRYKIRNSALNLHRFKIIKKEKSWKVEMNPLPP